MKVRVIDNTGHSDFLIEGYTYSVLDEDGESYFINRKDGSDAWYDKKRFEVVEDDSEQPSVDPVPVQSVPIHEQCELKMSNPLNIQIAGGHYKSMKIQPVEYAHANNLDFFQGSVVKYVTRFRNKNGKQDLEKAKHFIDLLIKLEYGEDNNE